MTPMRLDLRWRLLEGIVRCLRWLLRARIDVRGIEHLPRTGPAVLVFNHHSALDFIVLGWAVVVRGRRPIRFLGKAELWDSRWIGWAPRLVGAIPINRGSSSSRSDAYDAAVAALSAGDLVVVAPEQTISASFELLPFRTGAVRMAQQAGVPIVPIVGWGSQRYVARGIPLRPRFGLPLTVEFLAPRTPASDDDPIAFTEALRSAMHDALDGIQRDYPDGTPQGAPWVPHRLGGSAPDHETVLREFRQREQDWTGGPSSGESDDT